MTTLYTWRRIENGSLETVVGETSASFAAAAAFAWSPHHAGFAEVRDGRLNAPNGGTLAHVFEARVFDANHELRWWHPPDAPADQGVAVVLTEVDQPPPDGWTRVERSVDVLENGYLLWGRAAAHAPEAGWMTLLEARIGSLPVPVDGVQPRGRVVLQTIEYVDRIDDYGNRDVVDERVVRIRALSRTNTTEPTGVR